MTIKFEVATYLKQRGTPATPKHIKQALGKSQRNSGISRALTALEAEGKIIGSKRPVQNGWKVYEWNTSYSEGIPPGKVNAESKFTVGSEWNINGQKHEIMAKVGHNIVTANHDANMLLQWRVDDDFTAPWSEPKPQPKPESELRGKLDAWLNAPLPPLHHTARDLLSAIIAEIERLQKP